jgi:hypothetical protein
MARGDEVMPVSGDPETSMSTAAATGEPDTFELEMA